jgi:hypothetical protein
MGPTKTGERRTVPLPHFLTEQLGAYLAGQTHGLEDLVFTMPGGGPLRASKWGERDFRSACRGAARLTEGLCVHDLRHMAASLAIRENASVKIVQAMLGHRSATPPRHSTAFSEYLDPSTASRMVRNIGCLLSRCAYTIGSGGIGRPVPSGPSQKGPRWLVFFARGRGRGWVWFRGGSHRCDSRPRGGR